jgi:hypothetical protein
MLAGGIADASVACERPRSGGAGHVGRARDIVERRRTPTGPGLGSSPLDLSHGHHSPAGRGVPCGPPAGAVALRPGHTAGGRAQPRRAVARQEPVGDASAGDEDGTVVGKRHRVGSQVDDAGEVVAAIEGEDRSAWARPPRQARWSTVEVLASQRDGRPVQAERGRRVLLLTLHAEVRPHGELRQPRRPRAEAERRSVIGPRKGDAPPVAA